MKLVKTVYAAESFEDVEKALEKGYSVYVRDDNDYTYRAWLELELGKVIYILSDSSGITQRTLWEYTSGDYSHTNLDFIKSLVIEIPVTEL